MASVAKQKPTSELMPMHYMTAMKMKFEGAKYSEIAKRIGLTNQYVRVLFCKSGLLHHIYKEYAIAESEYREKTGRDILSAHIETVIKRLVTIATGSRSDMAAVAAIKETLDRVYGKSIDRRLIDANVAVGRMVDLFKEIKEEQDGSGDAGQSKESAE